MRVLFIAYFFPPKGGAGVQRSARFVRYLPGFGVEPVVLAGSASSLGAWDPLDDSLAREIGGEVRVVRPDTPPPAREAGGRLDRILGRPTPLDAWWSDVVLRRGREVLAGGGFDLVYVSMSPFSGWDPAVRLGREFDLPVVADLRDPWVLDEVVLWPTALHRARALSAMGRLVRASAAVIWNTPEARRAAEQELDPGSARFETLPNGYDAGDFEGLEHAPDPGAFRIVHSGTFHSALAARTGRGGRLRDLLGGSLVPVDHRGRTPWFLLEAMARVRRTSAEGLPLELHLYGSLSPADEALLARHPDLPVVRHGYQPHGTIAAALRSADVLFLPLYGLPPGRRARIVPGKTYEYLASRRPILAALPEGDARDLVLRAGAGPVAEPTSTEDLAGALEELLGAGRRPDRELGEEVLSLERRRSTRTLAALFGQLVAR